MLTPRALPIGRLESAVLQTAAAAAAFVVAAAAVAAAAAQC